LITTGSVVNGVVTRRLLMKWLDLALAPLLTVASKVLAAFYKIEIPLADIQRAIQKQFPIEKEKYWLLITLCDPVVRLNEGDNRIGIELTLRLRVPGNVSHQWRGLIEGRLEYNREKGEFYFFDPTLHQIHLDGSLRRYKNSVLTLVEALLEKAFSTTPVYKLNQEDFKHLLARLLLKSVTVQKDQIVAELGLY
jgi:hypothetical protein